MPVNGALLGLLVCDLHWLVIRSENEWRTFREHLIYSIVASVRSALAFARWCLSGKLFRLKILSLFFTNVV